MSKFQSIEEIRRRIAEVDKIYRETLEQQVDLAKRMDDLGISTMKSPIPFTEEVTMDNSQECQTPGAVFHTEVHSDNVSCKVNFPFHLELDVHESRELQDKLHDAMESVLASYWSQFGTDQIFPDGDVVRVVRVTEETEANLRELADALGNDVFLVGQVITLVDPYQTADVIAVNEDGSRAQIKYYDARDGGDIKRWIYRDDCRYHAGE